MTRTFLIPLALLGGSILIGIFYLRPAWDEFQRIRQETRYLGRLNAEFDKLITSRDELITKINAVPRRDLERIEQMIPKDARPLEYLVSLEQTVRQRGLVMGRLGIAIPVVARGATRETIPAIPTDGGEVATRAAPPLPRPTEISAGSKKPTTLFQELPVDLGVIGTYEILKLFLQDLELHARLTDIASLAFNTPGKESGEGSGPSGTGIFQFTLRLKTYYQ